MRIVCLSTLGVATGYVVDQLLAAFPNTQLIRLRYQPPARSWATRLRRLLRGEALRRIEERLFYRRLRDQGNDAVYRLLYGDQPAREHPVAAELSTAAMNQVAAHTLLRSCEPDVLITIGAPLLQPHIFTIPTYGTINVHFGIAPDYRGEETVFWPLYYRDEQRIGATIHQIDAGIDTGPMLAQGFTQVEPGDTEWTLEAKTARLGAELLVQLLRAGNLHPVRQSAGAGRGRQFNFSRRHVWHDARLLARRRWLRERLRESPKRVVNYCDVSDEPSAASSLYVLNS